MAKKYTDEQIREIIVRVRTAERLILKVAHTILNLLDANYRDDATANIQKLFEVVTSVKRLQVIEVQNMSALRAKRLIMEEIKEEEHLVEIFRTLLQHEDERVVTAAQKTLETLESEYDKEPSEVQLAA